MTFTRLARVLIFCAAFEISSAVTIEQHAAAEEKTAQQGVPDSSILPRDQCIARSVLMNLVMTIMGNSIGEMPSQPESLLPLDTLANRLSNDDLLRQEFDPKSEQLGRARLMDEARTLAKLSNIAGSEFAMSAFLTQLMKCQEKYL